MDLDRHELTIAGVARSYLLYRPPADSRQDEPLPLVLAFHGSGVDARQMSLFCGLHELAATERFVVAYPNGTGHNEQSLSWNAGNCCGYAHLRQIDDLTFVAALLDDIARRTTIDPARIYATGMSNGAMLAYRLAAEMSDRFAAIAPVGGPMGQDDCNPARPVSICHFHGTADDFAPYAGGVGKRSVSRANFLSVEHSIACWVRANGCDPAPSVEALPAAVDDGTRILRTIYLGGQEASQVVLYTIEGAGHTWPGRSTPFSILGRSTKNLDASATLWQFFQQHRR